MDFVNDMTIFVTRMGRRLAQMDSFPVIARKAKAHAESRVGECSSDLSAGGRPANDYSLGRFVRT